MGLITTTGKFCYVQCDRLNCSRKMEHVDEKLLREVADLCGWENDGNRWTCPSCAEQADNRKSVKTRGKSVRVELKA